MSTDLVSVTIDGRAVTAVGGCSALDAILGGGH